MRTVLVLGVVAAALAVPASAAQIDPMKLVLSQDDVPDGYVVDRDETLLVPNAFLTAYRPELRAIIARSGRVTGYYAEYTNYGPPKWRYVNSSVDVFRTPQGAELYMGQYLRLFLRDASKSLRPDAANVGDKALVYSGRPLGPGTFVIWREGRVLASVFCSEMNGHRKFALALARTQQRRIAAALR